MAKVRVSALAKEVGVTSKVLLERLNEMGEYVKSASSTVEAPVVRRYQEKFPVDKAAPAEAAAKPGAAPAKPAAKQSASAPAAPAAAASEPKAKKAAPKKAAAPLKLSASQDELLKRIGEAAEPGYTIAKKVEQRSIDSLLEKKLIKKGAKDKASGSIRYLISNAGKKHITTS